MTNNTTQFSNFNLKKILKKDNLSVDRCFSSAQLERYGF